MWKEKYSGKYGKLDLISLGISRELSCWTYKSTVLDWNASYEGEEFMYVHDVEDGTGEYQDAQRSFLERDGDMEMTGELVWK